MQQLQIFFTKSEETKFKIKEIRQVVKEALQNQSEYLEIIEKINTLRERKKQIEESVKEGFSSEITQLEDLLIDLDTDKEALSDAALSMLMKGETVEVMDEYNNRYEPVFKVSFKKV